MLVMITNDCKDPSLIILVDSAPLLSLYAMPCYAPILTACTCSHHRRPKPMGYPRGAREISNHARSSIRPSIHLSMHSSRGTTSQTPATFVLRRRPISRASNPPKSIVSLVFDGDDRRK